MLLSFTFRSIILALGWLLCAFVVQRASGIKADLQTYDAYSILGIATVSISSVHNDSRDRADEFVILFRERLRNKLRSITEGCHSSCTLITLLFTS